MTSSAGNTRGLIEAWCRGSQRPTASARLPRGIPAASLKLEDARLARIGLLRLPRGIPAASLKPVGVDHQPMHDRVGLPRGIPAASLKPLGVPAIAAASQGLPRGIPAASLKRGVQPQLSVYAGGLPRGIPAASLKRCRARPREQTLRRLPRGIPAASLKHNSCGLRASGSPVFRGEYPRPH